MITMITLGKQHHDAVDPILDAPRLKNQYERIMEFLSDNAWHTLFEISQATGAPHGSVGSQIRNARVDGHVISRRRSAPVGGTWEYKLEIPEISKFQQPNLI